MAAFKDWAELQRGCSKMRIGETFPFLLLCGTDRNTTRQPCGRLCVASNNTAP